jgi:KaiC/GvpD/RAD55 family RecA-like ATPase
LIVGAVTITPPITLSLWLNSTKEISSLSLTGALHERLPGSNNTLDAVSSTVLFSVTSGMNRYNLTLIPQQQLLPIYSTLSLGLKIAPMVGRNVTLFWGSYARASLVAIRLSGLESLSTSPPGPLQILDSSRNPTNSFDLNSTVPNNIVYFQALVLSAFGFQDIQNVNLTVLDPFSHVVKRELMTFVSQQSQLQPFVYTGSWVYPPNATSGTYQVNVAIIDIQNATSYSYTAIAHFGISPASIFSKPPFSLLPYFGIGGGGFVVGAVYYKRRKTKSYLAPFDYFNSLTGGELEGGTVVTVEGNTGSGKTLLTEQLMFEDLKKGRQCVFVATADFPSNVRANMRTMGFDVTGYEQNGLLTFVDGYSSEAGQESREKISTPSLGDLTTLGMKITSSLPSESFKGGSLYFDSLTPLASKAKPESLVSFVQSVGARVKGMGGKAFFTVGPSVDGIVQRRLEDMADCVVQMEAFEERGVRKSRLRIAKLRARRHQQGWVIYTIEDGKGIIFYSRKPRQ